MKPPHVKPPLTTYESAKRRARKEFGANGHVAVNPIASLAFPYQVGTYVGGRFIILGAGESWDAAFSDAQKRELVPGTAQPKGKP